MANHSAAVATRDAQNPRSALSPAQSGSGGEGAEFAPRENGMFSRLVAFAMTRLLKKIFRVGTLHVRLPGNAIVVAGDGTGSPVHIALTDPKWCMRVVLNPGLAVGEAYVDGALTIDQGDIGGLAEIIGRNMHLRPSPRPTAIAKWWHDWRSQRNSRRASRRNVESHYNLQAEFYRGFLDEDLQYSCAYFVSPGASLEYAQMAKKRHLAAKLLLRPGESVLDIGCGWGGLAMFLAETHDVHVDGITLSDEQLETAKRTASDRDLSHYARFSLGDYRDIHGRYDKIVSVGMLEHVGRPNFDRFFQQVADHLADDGVAVIHAIGRPEGPGFTNAWLARYIFPGGYSPALSEVTAAVERSGLFMADIEILRLHYAETLREWHARFAARRELIESQYGARFYRLWEFYLCNCEMAFRHEGHFVFQIQLTKRVDRVPVTRDYIQAAEHEGDQAAARRSP